MDKNKFVDDSNLKDDEEDDKELGGDSVNAKKFVDDESIEKEEPRNNKSKFRKMLFTVVFVLGISVYLSSVIIQGAQDILGLKNEDVQCQITIPQGASTGNIAGILKKNNIIKRPLVFKIYSKLKKTDGKYMHGTYMLSSKMAYEEIIDAFQNTNKRTDLVNITIPEGYTINQIASLLDENKVCDKERFINSIQDDIFNNEFLANVKRSEMVRYALEGYLFPDTYTFTIGQKPSFVIQTMLDNFEKKVYNPRKNNIEKSSKTELSEIITMASIVQKESTTFDVMKQVASVFHNRINSLREYPRLQSDATISYVEKDIKPTIEYTDQKMYDNYNTYVCKGLPVGPICNPGLEAIEATLHPDSTEYFYFLTDCENNYYWAKTLDQHNNNLHIAERLGSTKGIATGMKD